MISLQKSSPTIFYITYKITLYFLDIHDKILYKIYRNKVAMLTDVQQVKGEPYYEKPKGNNKNVTYWTFYISLHLI